MLPVSFLVALLIGAIITPTDPVLANSVVIGKTAEQNIPKRIRYLLSAEAGANDGGAYPLVFLAILLVGESIRPPLVEWSMRILLFEVVGAILLGVLIGAAVGRIERWVSDERYLEETSVFTITVALTLGVVGFVTLLGANEILAVFAAGLAYNWQALGWAGVALVVGILVLRRLPMIVAVSPAVKPLNRPAATFFMGWFGPIGIAAVFYATLAVRETGIEAIWPIVTLVVAGSVLVHGATETLLTLRYGRLDDDAEWW